jgi:hypothetical protein
LDKYNLNNLRKPKELLFRNYMRYLTELRCQMPHIDSILPVSIKIIIIIGNDKLFLCDKHMQRLIFYSNSPWENWEKEHLDKFAAFLEHENMQLPQGFREEEILRHLQAA